MSKKGTKKGGKKMSYAIMAALLLGSLAANAATFSLTLTNNATNVLSTARWNISEIKVTTGASPNTNALVNFYDNNVADITFTNAAWTSRTTVSTNLTNIVTSSTGILITNIYPGQVTTTITNAASTNALPIISAFSVNQNSVETRSTSIATVKGLVATCNTTNVVVTITYEPR